MHARHLGHRDCVKSINMYKVSLKPNMIHRHAKYFTNFRFAPKSLSLSSAGNKAIPSNDFIIRTVEKQAKQTLMTFQTKLRFD